MKPDYLISFQALPWESPQPGMEQKIYSDGLQRLRLVRFSDNFVEEHWCTRGHIGFVLSGEMTVDFDGTVTRFRAGDGLSIPAGEQARHKVRIEKGGQVELVLFEGEG